MQREMALGMSMAIQTPDPRYHVTSRLDRAQPIMQGSKNVLNVLEVLYGPIGQPFGCIGSSPKIQLNFRKGDLGVGETRCAGGVVHKPADMIDVAMSEDYCIDHFGLDSSGYQTLPEMPGGRRPPAVWANPGIDQHELTSRIDKQWACLEAKLICRD